MRDYRRLSVWTKGHALTLQVYSATKRFPRDEMYGLTSQLRRSMSSIPANIAEGCGRNSDRELARYLLIAMGSANETEYHLLLAKDLGYLPEADYGSFVMHVAEIKKMMSGLLSRLAPAATKAQSSKLEARSSELEV